MAVIFVVGCGQVNVDVAETGVKRCEAKEGYDYLSIEFDSGHPETSMVSFLGTFNRFSFHEQISDEPMTILFDLEEYYNCNRISDSQFQG